MSLWIEAPAMTTGRVALGPPRELLPPSVLRLARLSLTNETGCRPRDRLNLVRGLASLIPC